MKKNLTQQLLTEAFTLLSKRLDTNGSPAINLVVCGGSALIATGLVMRTTKDVDVAALIDDQRNVLDPEPLPDYLLTAVAETALTLSLPDNWLNNGPSRGQGGLFDLGLPENLVDRLILKEFGDKLKVYFISRYDQIHFKLYAAVDQMGSYHADDLKALNPTTEELVAAAHWAMTHDISEGFVLMLKELLKMIGFEDVIDKI